MKRNVSKSIVNKIADILLENATALSDYSEDGDFDDYEDEDDSDVILEKRAEKLARIIIMQVLQHIKKENDNKQKKTLVRSV